MGHPSDLPPVSWVQVFARQCPLIREADLATESLGDLWALFLGKLEGEGRGNEDSTSFQQDADSYASVASSKRESLSLIHI